MQCFCLCRSKFKYKMCHNLWYGMRNTSFAVTISPTTKLRSGCLHGLISPSFQKLHHTFKMDNGLHQFTVNMVIITVKSDHSLVTNHTARNTQNTVREEWEAWRFGPQLPFFISFLPLPVFHSLCASDTPWSCPFDTVCSCKMKHQRDKASNICWWQKIYTEQAYEHECICWVTHHWPLTK